MCSQVSHIKNTVVSSTPCSDIVTSLTVLTQHKLLKRQRVEQFALVDTVYIFINNSLSQIIL